MEGVSSILLWSIVVGVFVYFWNRIVKIYRIRRKLSHIVGPKAYPIIGNTLDLMIPHEEFLPLINSWFNIFRNKDLVKFCMFHETYIAPTKGQLLENVINSMQHITKANEYDFLFPWLGTGLLTSTGNKWRTRRKMLTPAFHFKILEDFIDVFNEQSEILVNILKKEVDKSFDIFPYITRCALDIICETAMGRHIDAQGKVDSDYVKAVYGISDVLHSRHFHPWLWPELLFNLFPEGRKHKNYLKILHGFTKKVIQEKKTELNLKKTSSSKPEDEEVMGRKKRLAFLDLLLEASEGGQKLSDEDLREEVDTFMFEGHDTTAAAISWTLYLLGHHPEIQRKVHEELDGIFSDQHCTVTTEHLKELKYLESVIKESLRLYPSVPLIARKLQQEVNMNGHDIPAGVTILIAPYFLHRDEQAFPNPEEFNPDRFSLENGYERHPYNYIPFSAGPRNCIGQKFAQMEEKIVLSHILRSFSIKSLVSRENVKPLLELILRPKDGIMVKLTPRIS